MTQMIVTLEPGADSSLLRKMIENMRGVGSVILKNINPSPATLNKEASSKRSNDEITEDWINEMRDLSNSFDSSLIDMADEKTQYILSR